MNKLKTFKGKTLYNPSGKAGEYSYWACNFFTGCSGMCDYCYNRTGIPAKVLGAPISTLKKCFEDEEHAIEVLRKEISKNLLSLQEHGLFFSFVSDPMLKENINLNFRAFGVCYLNNIKVKILTKQTRFSDWKIRMDEYPTVMLRTETMIGFTLTGHDELEPGCNTNLERINAMQILKSDEFDTWASIEPIIDFKSSLQMITQTKDFCDYYKIGLKSHTKYRNQDLLQFIRDVNTILGDKPIYWKDEIVELSGMPRKELSMNSVERNFKLLTWGK